MGQVDVVVKAFKYAAQNASPSAASIVNVTGPIVSIVSSWSQRNLERKATIQLQVTQVVDLESKDVKNLGAVETSTESLATYSPSGRKRALVREVAAVGKTPKKQYLEVWTGTRLTKAIDLTALEVHGEVYTDSDFGSLEWSECESKVVYIAEKKVPKTDSFLSAKSSCKKEESTKGTEYVYYEDWGEALVGKSSPVAVVARVDGSIEDHCDEDDEAMLIEEDVVVWDGIPPELSVGQVCWAPGGGIVGVAWASTPRRLGLVYCSNRTSWIFHLSPQATFRKLSGDGLAVRSPQFSPDKKSLVWLERTAGGPHHACHRLVHFDWQFSTTTTVIDIVDERTTCEGGESFYGLFNMNLRQCWLNDNQHLVLSTQQRASVKTYLVDTKTQRLWEIGGGGEDETHSQGLLTVKEDLVLCWRSSLLTTPGLFIAKVCPGSEVSWTEVMPPEDLSVGKEYCVKMMRLTAEEEGAPDQPSMNYSAIYLGPKEGSGVPLVVWPHGGPHSAFTNSYSLMAAFFTALGFGMVMVNYRGSTGNGERCVKWLLGRVGSSDVNDVHHAAETALKNNPSLDPCKTFLFGGSHGGFLVLHLAGQFPSSYKSCVALNPVVDLSMFSTSDIPDWAQVECGFEWSSLGDLSMEMVAKMSASSPLRLAGNVQAPVLLLLGRKDVRVPFYQGLQFYHALKARNMKTKVLMYEDNHPLSQPMHEVDFAVNTVLWYLESVDHKLPHLTLQ